MEETRVLNDLNSGKWVPVEAERWMRRAYGRTIVLESEGGTLRAALDSDEAPAQIDLRCEVTGRMLIQLYCNGRMVLDELVAHEELETFVDLERYCGAGMIELEMHLIPAPNGAVRVTQSVNALSAETTGGLLLGLPAELKVV